MGPPQIIMLSLIALNLGVSLAEHGKPRPNTNVYISLFSTCLSVGLLWWGGFWG